jgi:drug/metabolite transporter (DMT)-like permease
VKRSPMLLADLGLVGICLIWGTSFAIVKTVVGDTNPATFIAVRFAIAAVVTGAMCLGRRRGKSGGGVGVWIAGLLASVPLMAGFLTQTVGLGLTTASKAGFITGMHVVFTPIIDWLVTRRRIAPYQVAGIGVALVGLGLLSIETFGRLQLGDLLVLACAFFFAVHIVMLSRLSPRFDGFALSFTQMVGAALLAAAVAGPDMAQAAQFGAEMWASVIYLAVMATAVAYLVQTLAQRYTPPTRAALLMQLEPVFAAVFARLLIGEMMSARHYAGAAMILAGIIACQIGDARRTVEV